MTTRTLTDTAQTAAEAYERYQAAFNDNTLWQGSWHTERDGRQLACALGVLGNKVNSPGDCPAQIMPKWLARMVPWFYDNQAPKAANAWGLTFYAELARLNGVVPFEALYDWHANIVGPVGIETAIKRKRDTAPYEALIALHKRAMTGDRAPRDEWYKALKDAKADTYDAKVASYAYANAKAYASAIADATAYAYANANANATAYADADANAGAVNRMAVGFVECLSRVAAPSEQAA